MISESDRNEMHRGRKKRMFLIKRMRRRYTEYNFERLADQMEEFNSVEIDERFKMDMDTNVVRCVPGCRVYDPNDMD